MRTSPSKSEFDVIVIGTGPGGATVARELTKHNRRVLILDKGADKPVKDGVLSMSKVLNAISVGDGLKTARAFTVGGASSVYFGVYGPPQEQVFEALGIDLSSEVDETRRELPIIEIPDEFLGDQQLLLRHQATEYGLEWKKHEMLIDASRLRGGYGHDAKWNARTYAHDAVANGATLICGATATRIIEQKGRAIGVEYRLNGDRGAPVCAFAGHIVLAAGATSTPKILRDSGLCAGMDGSFYCYPGFVVFGLVPGLRGKESFVATMSAEIGNGLALGDGNFNRTLFRAYMLSNAKPMRLLKYAQSIGIGVVVKEDCGGGILEDGRFHKKINSADTEKLKHGEAMAREIIAHAGGKRVFRSRLIATHVGGSVKIGDYLDQNLQAPCLGLYICDGSIIPDAVKVPPTMTLICLAKRLGKHLSTICRDDNTIVHAT